MYVPLIYQADDKEWLRWVIRRYPLAVLVTNGRFLPNATHLPVIIPRAHEDRDELEGQVLIGHMNRANPHWAEITDGMAAKLIFSGPHGYITPSLYETVPAAPTWDFASVHLAGSVTLIEGIDAALDVVQETVAVLERDFGSGWEPDSSLCYFRKIGPGVGAFRFTVESAAGMFKFSQEKCPHIQDGIARHLKAGQQGHGRDLGQVMSDYLAAAAAQR